MRFIFLLIIPFLSFPQQDRLDQYFSSKNYSMYVSSFEDNFSLNQIDDLDSEVVSKYIISLLKSNFNSFGILPSRKLDNIKSKVESFILKNNSRTRDELLYEYGKSEFNLNRFKSSVIYLEKIKNKDDEINFLLGVGEFNNKNFEKSKLFLEQVSSNIYEDKKNLFLGIISYQAEEFDLALNYFDNISDKDLEKNTFNIL